MLKRNCVIKYVDNFDGIAQSTRGRQAEMPVPLATVAEVVVGLVEPVFARGVEDVQVHGIFEGPGFVGHVRGNAQDFAGVDDDILAINGEF